MDDAACNYDAGANVDDGSCDFVSCCMEEGACNYDVEATQEDDPANTRSTCMV